MLHHTRLIPTGLIAFSLLIFAPTAFALSITPDPLSYDIATLETGDLDFLGVTTGVPSGGIVLDGSVGAGDITLQFTLSIAASIGGIPFVVLDSGSASTSTGVGTVAGGGEDIVSAIHPSGVGAGTWFFDAVDGIQVGQTSDVFFISFSSLPIGINFLAQLSVLNIGFLEVVPEPGTGVLLSLAAGAFVASGRRRR